MKPELIILVGNIGSGKSTLTKRYQQHGYVIIARDWIRKVIGGGEYIFNPDYEPIIFATEKYMYKQFLTLGKNMVIDEVGLSKSMRKRYIPLAKKYGYKITAIVLPILSKEESIKRRLNDNHGNTDKKTWEMVWERFNSMYEEPTKKEGFHKIIKM